MPSPPRVRPRSRSPRGTPRDGTRSGTARGRPGRRCCARPAGPAALRCSRPAIIGSDGRRGSAVHRAGQPRRSCPQLAARPQRVALSPMSQQPPTHPFGEPPEGPSSAPPAGLGTRPALGRLPAVGGRAGARVGAARRAPGRTGAAVGEHRRVRPAAFASAAAGDPRRAGRRRADLGGDPAAARRPERRRQSEREPVGVPDAAPPGLPFLSPDERYSGRWEIVEHRWTDSGLEVEITRRRRPRPGELLVRRVQQHRRGSHRIRGRLRPAAVLRPADPARARRSPAGCSSRIERGPTTIILATAGGNQMSALPVSG